MGGNEAANRGKVMGKMRVGRTLTGKLLWGLLASAPWTIANAQAQSAPPAARAAEADPSAPQARPVPHEPTEAVVPARIEVRNDLGGSYKVTQVALLLDGREIARREAPSDGDLAKLFMAYDGPVVSGVHNLVARATVQGRSRGIFSYVDDYKINVDSAQSFVARGDRGAVTFTVVLSERKGVTIPFEQKPTLAFESQTTAPPSALAGTSDAVPTSTGF